MASSGREMGSSPHNRRDQHAAEKGFQHGDGGVQRGRAGVGGMAVKDQKIVEQVIDQRGEHPGQDGGGHDVNTVAQPGLKTGCTAAGTPARSTTLEDSDDTRNRQNGWPCTEE